MRRREVPATASIVEATGDARLFAPSADRNRQTIAALLCEVAPPTGRALELASGTGQHVITFAAALPDLHWQPSEIDADRRASITAYVAESDLETIAPVIALDATCPGWAREHNGFALIVLVNLLHLISDKEAETLISEAATALDPQGLLVIYGPFMRTGALTSDGDRRFHASLIEQDPEIGYKNDETIRTQMIAVGLTELQTRDMPANNIALIARRP